MDNSRYAWLPQNPQSPYRRTNQAFRAGRNLFLGDYIDRGPDSKGLIDYLIKLKDDGYRLRFLKGNHEDWCIQSYEEEFKLKTRFLLFREKTSKNRNG